MASAENKEETETSISKHPVIIFNVTGFGKFGGVEDNPTSHLMTNLPKIIEVDVKKETFPKNVTMESYSVLHVSGENSLKKLVDIRTKSAETIKSNTKNEKEDKQEKEIIKVYLHFGVGNRHYIKIEGIGYNCANFRIPDELGWEPKDQPIVSSNGDTKHENHCRLPVDILTKRMSQKGYKVESSVDPGRYVCNWIYYNSLELCKNNNNEYALFVHVPPFEDINEETQTKFARDLILEIYDILANPKKSIK
ncbi:pyroglutamyl-peptidase I [Reticulomyxa filosa]|uniref:Pyroglutamyl-peptidase I n=1 Tax=Reticulomyxa filosa TaxID=46433 RepID=X6PF70_RETFI|nr:pyroglutamyl-peptidase I [Reticulomyxa filosa]|eukprot:ETO36322.1 pyroglutamyl-peptidase I [Reticulomyxa filosa]